jgi:heme/copper-type cytochrome/quinol oxidase subunit 1
MIGAEITLTDDIERAQLEHTWRAPSGMLAWFKNTDHKVIGRRYIASAFIFFILGGLEAAAMRVQLARPENSFIGPDLYNQIFTMHGTTMMFLFGVPIQIAMATYIVPLMLGTRNISFPRLNAFGFYTYLAGGIFLYTAFLLNTGPDAGWFGYVPLSGPSIRRASAWMYGRRRSRSPRSRGFLRRLH